MTPNDGNIITQNPTIATIISMLVTALGAFVAGKVRSGSAADKQLTELRGDFQERLKELRTDFDNRVQELREEYERQITSCDALTKYERERAERMTQLLLETTRTMQELQQQVRKQR